MKKSMYILVLFVAVSLFVGTWFVADAAQDSHQASAEPIQIQDPVPEVPPADPDEIPPLVGGKVADRPIVLVESLPATQGTETDAESTINVWYGDSQKFGQLGNPQQWVNILGNVFSVSGIDSLSYSLNGGGENPLSIGPNNNRLNEKGDFNIEIDFADLNNGNNTVSIKSVDKTGAATTQDVSVNYTAGQKWDESYNADWSTSSNVQNIAQVVDGKWEISGSEISISGDSVGYDRLVAIGDMGDAPSKFWTDYEVTVPITVKAIETPGTTGATQPGIGIGLRWQGHNLADAEQPRRAWERTGAFGWYRWKGVENSGQVLEALQLIGRGWTGPENSTKVLDFNKTYIFKMSVQSSLNDNRAYYRLKFWEQGKSEPGAWDIEKLSPLDKQQAGSMLLVAHRVSAEFGEVRIRPLDQMRFSLSTSAQGNGTLTVDPSDPSNPGLVENLTYGQRVTLVGSPGFNSYLHSWSGDLSVPGTVNPLIFSITQDMDITANFRNASPGSLDVDVVGGGKVTVEPDQDVYAGGQIVKLSAAEDPGFIFSKWSGAIDSTNNPEVIQIDGDMNVVATFVEAGAVSPTSDDFDRCALSTNLWTFINPTGDGNVALADGALRITVPGGNEHMMWNGSRDALRIMQETENQDFTVELKFDSIPQEKYQIQGFLVEQDASNWIRFDIFNSGTGLKMFAGVTEGGVSDGKVATAFSAGNASAVYLRVARIGDLWTVAYSLDGLNWTAESFSHQLTVNSTGVFASNQAPNSGADAPAFVMVADYFKNKSYPTGITGYLLSYAVAGEGSVEVTPLPGSNGRYVCDQEVTLKASPVDTFTTWAGDIKGSQNPAKLTMNGDKSVTAVFEVEAFLPAIMRP